MGGRGPRAPRPPGRAQGWPRAGPVELPGGGGPACMPACESARGAARTAICEPRRPAWCSFDVSTTAVILAAGRGTRLRAPCKPLAIVGGQTLLERAVRTASAAGIHRVVVVVDSPEGAVASFC